MDDDDDNDNDGIDTDFIGVDKQFMYAPRAQNPTKNVIKSTTNNGKQYDKCNHPSNKIVIKKLMHRIGNKQRKTKAGFVTFKE